MVHGAWSKVWVTWDSTWNAHQATHTGQGRRSLGPVMGHRQRNVCEAGHGSERMTQGQGTQGAGFDRWQWGTEGPFFMSVPGAPAWSSRSQFSPLTKACLLFFLLLPVSLDAKEWECPRGVGPRVPPIIPPAQTGQGWGPSPWFRKSLPGPQVPSLRGSCEHSVGWTRAG